MSGKKSFRSAVVIIPPESLWSQIQNIRSLYDRAYDKWMPHINLVFPFFEDDQNGKTFYKAAKDIQDKLFFIKPFKIRFTKDSFNYFVHGKKYSVHLKPLVGLDEDLEDQEFVSEIEEFDEKEEEEAEKETESDEDGGSNNEINNDEQHNTSAAGEEKKISQGQNDQKYTSTFAQYIEPEPTYVNTFANEDGYGDQYTENTDNLSKSPVDIFSNPPIPVKFQGMAEPSIDSLRDAVWGNYSHPSSTTGPLSLKTQFVETIQNKVYDKRVFMENKLEKELQTRRETAPGTYIENAEETPSKGQTQNRLERNHFEAPTTSENVSEDDKYVPVSTLYKKPSKRHRKKKMKRVPKPPTFHPEMNNLQSVVEACYPTLNELCMKSEHGFQPHLTLGQFDQKTASEMISKFKEDWEHIEFMVTDVHLISRKGNDMHQIRQTIHLGI